MTDREPFSKPGWKPKASTELPQQSLRLAFGWSTELTDLSFLFQLRGASEYEERKLIRAAIRKLRTEEIEGTAPGSETGRP